MEWIQLFRPHILDRGAEYSEDEKVFDLLIEDGTVSAKVRGTDTYEVTIHLDGEDVLDMSCDCPYALEGHNCKHMAAVLFSYEAFLSEEDMESPRAESEFPGFMWEENFKRAQNEAERLVEKIPEADIRALLVRYVINDAALKNRLQLKYDFQMNAKQMTALKNEVLQIVYHYGDRGGYIDWYHASDFLAELESFLDARIPMLLEHGCCMQAFELTNLVLHKAGTVDIDDSDGGMMSLAETCSKCWKMILDQCSDPEKGKIKEWFAKLPSGYVIDYMEDYVREFAEETFPSDEQLKNKIHQLDLIIEKHKDRNDCGQLYSIYKGYEDVLLKRIECMQRLGMHQDEIMQFRREHRHFFTIRELEIKEALKQGNTQEAESILTESRQLDAGYPGQVKKYSKQLIEIYRQENRMEEYGKELLFLLLNCSQQDLTYFNELKKSFHGEHEEWRETVDQIIMHSKNDSFICEVLNEEKRYSELMEFIEKSRDVFWLNEYEKVLKKTFPDRVISVYVFYVLKEMELANSRKHYQHLVQYLKKIAKIKNGKDEAENIAHRWRMEYKRRSALMDELRKAGF